MNRLATRPHPEETTLLTDEPGYAPDMPASEAEAPRKGRAAEAFDRFFAGSEKLEDYYDDRFRFQSGLGWALAGLLAAFLVWAFFATVEEVSRGEGKVVPSSKTQVIQSLEGGIAKEIVVRQGQTVRKDQLLVRLDDTGFSSTMGELDAKRDALRAQIERLRFEAAITPGSKLEYPPDLIAAAPDVVASEQRLHQVRMVNFDNQAGILNERLRQRRIELSELKANLDRFKDNLAIAQREFEIKSPLAAQKVVPETEILRLKREMSDLGGQVRSANLAIPRLEAAILEAERQLDDHKLNFRQTAQQDLNQRIAELSVVEQTLKGAKDRVFRTDVRSPVDGIINKLNFTNIGSVVRPGEVIAEIVPLEDALLIEVRIKPSDIAFIHLNQEAVVRVSAYDFSIYGSLRGKVVSLSPDSITDPNTKETYYNVMVQTKESALRARGELLPIMPGMIATVDIITGAKSILQYILKPIVKAKDSAFRER